MIELTLPEAPSSNRYWRHANGRTFVSAEAKAYRLAVQAACLKARVKPMTGDVKLTVVWFRGRRAGDTTNRVKVLEDALQGYCYHNDSQVAELHVRRHDDKRDPRMEVVVEAA